MMTGFDSCACRYLLKEKKHSLTIEGIRDRPMDGGQKLKKRWEENRKGLCWLEKKKVIGKFYLIYLGLITRAFSGKCMGGADSDSEPY